MTNSFENRKQIIEAAIFAAGEPLSIDKLMQLFTEEECPSKDQFREILAEIAVDYEGRGVALVEVASGYRFQARADYAMWLQRLWEKKPARYTYAFLETLALIVYKQPITRGEIEEIRGVAVNVNIMKQLQERGWIKIVGHKEVPGKPALFGTTKEFLDYFNIKKLSEMPTLADVVDLEEMEKRLEAQMNLSFKEKANTSDAATAEMISAHNDDEKIEEAIEENPVDEYETVENA